ncbi:proprotein convertase P-domain-containing protein [Acanthopleuribacter pedis]|uniref:Proprotein convertase P-domain-containing protein n=1 Tax=Acanthopleuribacter pedis TaxID=442870 RepID=A0A8J7Q5A4_9BACT|nr:proprotein convertase P-domain-containing protein [Acanthopleuribacter pedis]MBO1320677.1 proprotein convertase P-domain-containing protein [Acanthopleuribacter pedis]
MSLQPLMLKIVMCVFCGFLLAQGSVLRAQCPAEAGDDIRGCLPTGTTTNTGLFGNDPGAGNTGMWTVVSPAGQGAFNDPTDPNASFTAEVDVEYTLRWTITQADTTTCSDDTVVLFSSPTTANAGADQTGMTNGVCGTSTTLAATAVTLGTGTWSIVSGDGNGYFGATPGTVTSNNEADTFNGTAGQTYTLRWTTVNGLCNAETDDVDIEFFEPVVANAGSDQDVCGTTTFLGATPSSGTGSWSITSGAGGTVSTPTSATSQFSGVVGTEYTLQWTETNGSCSGNDSVTITFYDNPTVAAAGADQDVCAASATLAANAAAGFEETGTWSVVAGSGGSFSDANSPTATFSGTRGVSYTLRWTISNGVCPISSDDVVVDLREDVVPNAGSNQSVCGTSTFLGASLSTGTDGSWSITSGAGGTVTTPTSPTSAFSGTLGTTYVLTWTENNGSCSDTDTVSITFFDNPTVAAAGADQTLCADTATLAGNAASGFQESGSWSVVSGVGGSFADATSPTTTFTGTKGVTYTLRWTITNGVCPISSDDVVIELLEDLAPAAGADQNVCGTSTTLGASLSTGSGGTWSIVSGAGGTITTPSSPTSNFTGTVDTTYVLQWEETNGTCQDTDTVSITFYDSPVAAAGADQDICGSSATLAANAASGLDVTGSWSIVSGDGNGYFGSTPGTTSSTNEADTFNGTQGASYTLRWTLTNGVCPLSSDDVVVTFNSEPTVAEAGSQKVFCPPEGGALIIAMTANAPGAGETGLWSVTSSSPGGAAFSFNDATSPTTSFSGDLNTTYQLRWTITPDSGPCPPSTDDVQVFFGAPPPTATATDQTVCSDTATLDGSDPDGRTAVWTITSGDGNGYFGGVPGTLTTNNPTDTFTGTRGTSYGLRYTVESGSLCADSFANVTISLVDDPTPANAGPDQTGVNAVCGVNATLGATAASVGTGTWTITGAADGMGVLADANDPTTTFTGTPGQTYTLTWTTANAPCTDSTDTVDIEFVDTVVAQAGADQAVCADPTRMDQSGGTTALNDNATTTDVITVTDPGAGTYPNGATILGVDVFVQITHTELSQVDLMLTSPMGTMVQIFDGSTKCNVSGNAANLGFRDGATGDMCRGMTGTVAYLPQFIAPQAALSALNGEAVTGMWTLTVTDNETGETGTLNGWSLGFRTQNNATTTLAATTPALGTGQWTITSGDGRGYFGVTPGTTTSNNPTDTFTGTSGQNYTLQWEVTGSDPCPLTSDSVDISFQPDNDAVGSDEPIFGGMANGVELCEGSGTMIQLNATVEPANATLGTWTITSGDGNGYFDGTPGTLTSNLPNATFHGTNGTDYGLTWSVTNQCDTSSSMITARFSPTPSTADAGVDANACPPGGLTATVPLSGTAPTVGIGVWSIQSADPAANLGGETFSDPSSPTSTFTGNVGTTYELRWEVFTGTTCVSSDVTEVIIKELPIANAGADQLLCVASTILGGNDPADPNVTGTWRVITGDGNASFGDVNAFNSTFTGTRGFTYLLEWALREDVCSTSDQVEILLVEDPIATATSQQSCTTSVTLDGGHNGVAGSLPSRGAGTWTIVSTDPINNTNGRFGSTNSTTSTQGDDTFTGDAGVSYTLQWLLTNSPCREDSTQITIDFLEAPDTPNGGSDQTVCAGGAKMTATLGPDAIPDDGTSTFSNSITVDRFGTVSDLNVMLNFEHANADDLRATLTHVESGRTLVLIDLLSCGAASAGMRIYDDEATAAVSCATGYQRPFGNVTRGGSNGLDVFDGVSLAGEWRLDILDDTVGNTGQITSWGLNFNQGTVNLAGLPDPLSDPSYNGNWVFATNGNTDEFGFFTSVPGTTETTPANSGFTTTFTGSAGETYTLAFQTANAICVLPDEVSITFEAAPTLATAGDDEEICGASYTLAGNTPAVGTGTWTIVSATPIDADLGANPGGESFAPDANTPTATFTGNRGYVYVLRWTVLNGSCGTGNQDDVSITLNMDPATAAAGDDRTICDTLSTNLAGNTPGAGMGDGTWTFTGPGNAVFTTTDAGTYPNGANDPGALVTVDALGTYVFTWTIASGNCTPSADTVSLTFGNTPTAANAGPDQSGATGACDGSAQLAANAAGAGESGRWTYTGPDMNGVFSDDTSPTSTFTGTIGATYTLTWTISNGICPDTSDTLDVEFRPLLTANAGDDQLVCDQDPATLTATLSNGTGGTWSITSGDGNGVIATPNATTTTFTGTTGVSYVLQWEETDGVNCTAIDTVNVQFFSTPTAEAGADFSACLIDTITLGATAPGVGTGTWTVESGPNGAATSFSDANSPTSTFTTDLIGEYVLQWEVASGSCVLADTVTLTIQDVDVLVPVSIAQGLNFVVLDANPTCFSNDVTIQWRDVTNASDFPAGNPVTLDPAPQATTVYSVTVDENANSNTATAQVTVLVGESTSFLDLNGDLCNDERDVAFLAPDWLMLTEEDANGDGIINVLDFLYIRVEDCVD